MLFWDKDVRLARALEACGARLTNPAEAVALCDDKAATHLVLAKAGVPMPRTLVAPMTYLSFDAPGEEFLRLGAQKLGFPLVVKECFGSLGGQVYLAEDAAGLRRLADAMGPKPFLLQEFVVASAGTDKRLYVVGNRVAAAMQRRSDTDFRANIGLGGHGGAYSPTPEEETLALRCCRLLGAEIAGVDLLEDADRAAPRLRGQLERPDRGDHRVYRRRCCGLHRGRMSSGAACLKKTAPMLVFWGIPWYNERRCGRLRPCI